MPNEMDKILRLAAEEAVLCDSLYKGTAAEQKELLLFLKHNGWQIVNPKKPSPTLRNILHLWLSTYKRTTSEKQRILLHTFTDKLPKTCCRLSAFLTQNNLLHMPAALDMTDYLLSELDKEIELYTEEELTQLVNAASISVSLASARLLTSFLQYRHEANPITDWEYVFKERSHTVSQQSAYSLTEYARLAWIIFNRDSWEENKLPAKAAESKRYANLWLYTAMHFVCAIRKSDLERLPKPSLKYPAEQIRKMICEDCYPLEDACAVVDELLFLLETKPIFPHKTERFSAVPSLKLFVPESIRKPLGIIMSLSLSFCGTEDPFVQTTYVPLDAARFFGEQFLTVTKGKNFLSRRANKAYLQGLAASADDIDVVKAKGYMIAALARSHKSGIGQMPEITDVYLQDGNFTGYRPEFILFQMFERGIFGFIPALLLESYAGKQYRSLPVTAQTELISLLGLSPAQLEVLAECVQQSHSGAMEIVSAVLHDLSGNRKQLEQILCRIASGAAPSKQPEYLCIRLACGYTCMDPLRSGCLGCGHEIYTKSAFHLLMKEYTRILDAAHQADFQESARLKGILNQGILPALSEILTSLPMLYPETDMNPYIEMLERGTVRAKYSDS